MKNRFYGKNESNMNQNNSLSIAAYSAYVFSIISLISKVVKNPNSNSYYFEVGIILIMTFSIFAYRIVTKVYNLPVKITGSKTINLDKDGWKSRMIHYFKKSIVFSTFFFFSKFIILNKQYTFSSFIYNKKILIFLEILFILFIAFTTDIIWYETNIILYKKRNLK